VSLFIKTGFFSPLDLGLSIPIGIFPVLWTLETSSFNGMSINNGVGILVEGVFTKEKAWEEFCKYTNK
jgi:hypothetical protein